MVYAFTRWEVCAVFPVWVIYTLLQLRFANFFLQYSILFASSLYLEQTNFGLIQLISFFNELYFTLSRLWGVSPKDFSQSFIVLHFIFLSDSSWVNIWIWCKVFFQVRECSRPFVDTFYLFSEIFFFNHKDVFNFVKPPPHQWRWLRGSFYSILLSGVHIDLFLGQIPLDRDVQFCYYDAGFGLLF